MNIELSRLEELIDNLIYFCGKTSGDCRNPKLRTAKQNLLDEFTRLQLRITTLERIMEREAEKTAKAGMP